MSQSFLPVVDGQVIDNVLKTTLPDRDEALRTSFSGASAPSSPVAYQIWADTSTGLLKRRNSANSDWDTIGHLHRDASEHSVMVGELATLSASRKLFVPPQRVSGAIRRVVVVSDTATTSDASNKWQVTLKNLTQASASLFSATPSTEDVVAGVGGGEIVANAAWVLLPDQNATFAADEVLEIELVKVGAPTTLARLSVFVEISRAG